MVDAHDLSIRKACRSVGLSRAAWYRPRIDWLERDRPLAEALGEMADRKPGLGFWKLFRRLRRQGHRWNHKRVWRVYCLMKLNRRRRTKKRIPEREPAPLIVPSRPNQVWSADFMSDALYHGVRFRTFNVLDDFNREILAIEIDTSLPSERLTRVFEQIKATRDLPDVLRTDNGPEFLGERFTSWCQDNGIMIKYIEPGKPNQNAYIERFNRLGGMTPAEALKRARSSTHTELECSTPGYFGIWTKYERSHGHGCLNTTKSETMTVSVG